MTMTRRLAVLAVGFIGAAVYVHAAMAPERVPLREPLRTMPLQLGEWAGRDQPKMTDQVLHVLGVDEYINRVYHLTPAEAVGLYVGYYQSQREGDTIHSPMNCLPGAGWQPVSTGKMGVPIVGRERPITVNQVIIQKNLERQVVLYWYQSHGRVVASEYWSKIFMVIDAIRTNRSDAALVRVTSPILTGDSGVSDAEERARAFVQTMFPQLSRHLPS